jgi:hypothetical protein
MQKMCLLLGGGRLHQDFHSRTGRRERNWLSGGKLAGFELVREVGYDFPGAHANKGLCIYPLTVGWPGC